MELFRHSVGRLVLIFCFYSGLSFAQQAPINWGPLEAQPGFLLDVLPIRSGDFYTIRYTGGLLGTYKSTVHNQLAYVSQNRIKPITENGIGTVDGATYFAGQLRVFVSDKSNGVMSLFCQTNEDDGSINSQLCSSYSDTKIGAKPNFQFAQSQNGKFLAVYYDIPGRKENRDVYGYVVYDSTFTKIQQGEYLLPFDGNMTTINEHHLTNQGNYLLVITEHKEKNDRFFGREWENFKALHVYRIANDSLKSFNVTLQDKRIDDILISSNDNQHVVMTGLYGRGNRSGLEGVFTMTMDLNRDSIISYKYSTFNQEIFEETLVEKQMSRMERRWEQRDESPQIYSYKLRQLQTLADGSQLGFMEQYYERKYTNYDSRTGITTMVYYYYYMDIIAFKLDINGSFLWGKRIPKNQISMNDNGPYSSFVACNNNQEAYVIFNDNKRNYSDEGFFNGTPDNIQGLSLSYRKNAVAIVKINLENGALDRSVLFSKKDLSALVIPKQMHVDWKNMELLMYAINRNREKFGILSFK
jgi:hypothetical protein